MLRLINVQLLNKVLKSLCGLHTLFDCERMKFIFAYQCALTNHIYITSNEQKVKLSENLLTLLYIYLLLAVVVCHESSALMTRYK